MNNAWVYLLRFGMVGVTETKIDCGQSCTARAVEGRQSLWDLGGEGAAHFVPLFLLIFMNSFHGTKCMHFFYQ